MRCCVTPKCLRCGKEIPIMEAIVHRSMCQECWQKSLDEFEGTKK